MMAFVLLMANHQDSIVEQALLGAGAADGAGRSRCCSCCWPHASND
jgi:hypothetical protein